MEKATRVSGLPYRFPESHILAMVGPSEGHTFVRLFPPGEHFQLVYDQSANEIALREHRIVISKINTSKFSDVKITQNGPLTVYCGDVILEYTCGFHIDDGSVPWSVVFSHRDLKNTIDIQIKALELLARYRS